MQRALNQFDNNLKAVKEMEALHIHLTNNLKLSNDLSDILRAQLVYAVSALDKLIHELVRIGMLKSFSGKRRKTSKFNNFSISLATHEKIRSLALNSNTIQLETPERIFELEIIQKHKYLSFQEPSNIADALSHIWEEKQKWQKIADFLGSTDHDVKTRLKSIVSRRNQIVHEADIDWQSGLRTNIDPQDVTEAVEFIQQIGHTIFNLINDYD